MGRGKERSEKLIVRDVMKLVERRGDFSYRVAMEFCKVGYPRLARIVRKYDLRKYLRPYAGRRGLWAKRKRRR